MDETLPQTKHDGEEQWPESTRREHILWSYRLIGSLATPIKESECLKMLGGGTLR
jgi:hypothetical protein